MFELNPDWKYIKSKKRVKCSRYRPGMAQRVGRGIVLFFHDRSTRRVWVVSSTPRLHFTPVKDPLPIVQEAHYESSSSSVICQTTGPKPLPERFLHIVRSRASSFNWQYPLLSLRSSSTFLRLLPRLLVTTICPFIFHIKSTGEKKKRDGVPLVQAYKLSGVPIAANCWVKGMQRVKDHRLPNQIPNSIPNQDKSSDALLLDLREVLKIGKTGWHNLWLVTGDLGVDGWIILGWISRRWDVGTWTGLGWPKTGTGGGRLWVR